PPGRKLARHPLLQLPCEIRVCRSVAFPVLAPAAFQLIPPPNGTMPVRESVFWDEERGLPGPAHDLFGPADLFGSQRRSMRLGGVALLRRRVGDHRSKRNQCRPGGLVARSLERGADGGEVIPVTHLDHAPAVSLEPAGDILAERERRV